jgi:hypothetical protein
MADECVEFCLESNVKLTERHLVAAVLVDHFAFVNPMIDAAGERLVFALVRHALSVASRR